MHLLIPAWETCFWDQSHHLCCEAGKPQWNGGQPSASPIYDIVTTMKIPVSEAASLIQSGFALTQYYTQHKSDTKVRLSTPQKTFQIGIAITRNTTPPPPQGFVVIILENIDGATYILCCTYHHKVKRSCDGPVLPGPGPDRSWSGSYARWRRPWVCWMVSGNWSGDCLPPPRRTHGLVHWQGRSPELDWKNESETETKLIGSWRIWMKFQKNYFQCNFRDWWLRYILWNCLHMSVTGH